METVGLMKAWMAEHVFVTVAAAAGLAVILTMLVLFVASASKRHLWRWLFRLMSLTGAALGVTAIALGVRTGTTGMLEVGIGYVVATLVGYCAGMRYAREHEGEWVAVQAALEKAKADIAKLKDQNASIRLVVDPQTLK